MCFLLLPFFGDHIMATDNLPQLQQSQWQRWKQTESTRSPPPLPHPVWPGMEWCCCSSHTFTQQVQCGWVSKWVEGCRGWEGVFSAQPPLSGAADWLSSNSPLVFASSPSFMWLPHGVTALPNQCKICGGETEQRNGRQRRGLVKAKQNKQTNKRRRTARVISNTQWSRHTAVLLSSAALLPLPVCARPNRESRV